MVLLDLSFHIFYPILPATKVIKDAKPSEQIVTAIKEVNNKFWTGILKKLLSRNVIPRMIINPEEKDISEFMLSLSTYNPLCANMIFDTKINTVIPASALKSAHKLGIIYLLFFI
jgi:hypothetical protein